MGLLNSLRTMLARSGRVSCADERTFWVHGATRGDFEAVRPFLAALHARFPRLGLVLSAHQAEVRAWLAEVFVDATVVPPPWPLGPCATRYLVNLNARGLMLLGPVGATERALMASAHHRAMPAVLVDTGALPTPVATPELALLRHAFVSSEAMDRVLGESGLVEEHITDLPVDSEAWAQPLLAGIDPLLTQDLKLIRSGRRPVRRHLERLAMAALDSGFWRRALAFKVERIDTLDQLGARLCHPDTILCLGNGPSSESAAVEAERFDCLFRVNHSWMQRGFLTAPDMVFTGSKASISALRVPILGLQTMRSEARLLVTRFLLPTPRRVTYATAERFGLFLYSPAWQGVRPTNGAAMLATAVALQPKRLVIAGIDLFSHPDGAYPGDSATPNAYSPGHEAESEAQLLVEALTHYRGELIILSEALADRWAAYQSSVHNAPPRDRTQAV